MPRLIRFVFVMGLVFGGLSVLTPETADANRRKHRRAKRAKHRKVKRHYAPELDPSLAGQAAVLLLGGLFLVERRRKHS